MLQYKHDVEHDGLFLWPLCFKHDSYIEKSFSKHYNLLIKAPKDIENIEEKELSQNKRDVNNNKINDEITVNRSNSEYNSETSSPQTQSSLTAENSNFLSPASTTDNLLTVKVEDSEFSTFEVFKTVRDVIDLPARIIIS